MQGSDHETAGDVPPHSRWDVHPLEQPKYRGRLLARPHESLTLAHKIQRRTGYLALDYPVMERPVRHVPQPHPTWKLVTLPGHPFKGVVPAKQEHDKPPMGVPSHLGLLRTDSTRTGPTSVRLEARFVFGSQSRAWNRSQDRGARGS